MMSEAYEIVKKMLSQDEFSNWLGVKLLDISPGYCKLSLIVKEQMLNGFQIAHGGICFSISDSALAFAANTYGVKCYTIETSLIYHQKVFLGDQLIAETSELSRDSKKAVYKVNVVNKRNELISTFKGVVYVSDKKWEI